MDRTDCAAVIRFLDEFGKASPSSEGLDRISEHMKECRACFRRVADFFKLMKAPETGYLEETLDDLVLSLYNLVKALLKHAPPEKDEDRHENLRFTSEPGQAEDYIRDGAEAIDDVEDFLGSSEARGENMEELRTLFVHSQRKLAFELLQKGVDLGGLYSLDCRNLQGVLHLFANRLPEAEKAFSSVIAAAPTEPYVRRVQMHAMINLAYVHQRQKRYNDAVKWAERSKSLAEEIGVDSFTSRFGLAYFRLLRNAADDLSVATAEVRAMMDLPETAAELRRYLAMPSNKVILDVYRERGLADVVSPH